MRKRIGIRDIKALQPGQVIWDAAVTGFGARRQKSDAIVYFVFYRSAQRRQRWFSLGKHGAPWTPDTARSEARRLLGRVAAGEDPANTKEAHRKTLTVAELCDRYFADAETGRVLKRNGVSKKASTLAADKSRIARHLKPLVGSLVVTAFTRQDAERLLYDIAEGRGATKGGKGVASRSLSLLGAVFTYGIRRGLCSRLDNPVHGTPRFADSRRERRLSDKEYGLLGEGLRKAAKEGEWPPAIAAARLIALTGWRRGEALGLRWDELDLERRTATLGDTKTGRSMRPLSQAACDLLQRQPRGPNALVFAGAHGGNGSDTFKRQFRRVAAFGGLPADISAHTLRHAFVSVAADLGFSDLTIGALVGHRGRSVTSRYAHGADAVLLAAADKVATHIAELMDARASKRIRRAA
jgi:integrase